MIIIIIIIITIIWNWKLDKFTFFISTFFISYNDFPKTLWTSKTLWKVENLIKIKQKYNLPYQSYFSIRYHSFFYNTISRREIRGGVPTMLFAKAATGGVLGKRGVLKSRCSESYQVKFAVTILEKCQWGSSHLLK